jgi:hypothetical protein
MRVRSGGAVDHLNHHGSIKKPRNSERCRTLRDFSAPEWKELQFLLDRAADAVEALLADGLTAAQNRFHGSGLAETTD